ncbi:MAG: dephospho-CoA kinase [Anaerolineae bacterium]|nr:dephospho-CoA kinase [Anaerolineae bacterium]
MSRWANKYVIGLTGNIAVGKSVVRQMLQHLGAYTVDADGLTHRAMAPGAPAYKPVVETFGQFILDADKNINRAMLGQIVFANPEALAKLEAIVHPVIAQAVGTLVARSTQPIAVIEAIKLVEGDLGKAVDEIWVVDASPETQYRRLIGPRKMSEAEAKQRIMAQRPQAEKLAKATVVIKNDGNVDETWKQVQAAYANSLKRAQGSAPAQPAAQPAPAVPAAPASAANASTDPTVPARAVTAPLKPPPQLDTVDASGVRIHVKRGMPSNAEVIANFISQTSGKAVNRMDVMMAFGQKSYLLAQDATDNLLAVLGWQVENLITRVDEFYIASGAPATAVVNGLVVAIEAASKDLQSEVAYIFLPNGTSADTVQTFVKNGYEATTVEQIKIPAWREAVQEIISDNKSAQILSKKLREDRVLKPI